MPVTWSCLSCKLCMLFLSKISKPNKALEAIYFQIKVFSGSHYTHRFWRLQKKLKFRNKLYPSTDETNGWWNMEATDYHFRVLLEVNGNDGALVRPSSSWFFSFACRTGYDSYSCPIGLVRIDDIKRSIAFLKAKQYYLHENTAVRRTN